MYKICRLKQCLLLGVSILFLRCTAIRETYPAVTGVDRDKHGCIPSAGFVWSELKQECLRPFELDTRLMEVENNASTFSRQVGILFSKDGERCEVFLGNKPVILKHLDKGQFSNEFAKKQFVLRLENDKWHLLINDTIRFIELAK